MSGRRAFEDFQVGDVLALGERTVTAEEIVEFASEFDMQPMHLDEKAGRESLLGGLSASGWHTCCIFMRMICDTMILNSTSQGSPGIDSVRWRNPVRAGDRLTGTCTVTARRLSASRPGLGLVSCRNVLVNQRGEEVLELENTAMFLTREAAA